MLDKDSLMESEGSMNNDNNRGYTNNTSNDNARDINMLLVAVVMSLCC